MFLEVKNITKTYGPIVAVKDVSFALAEGAILSLLGPSGCGKTTLLRLIAGLEQADSGAIAVNGRPPPDAPYKRDFGMVFQQFALFPHLTVFGNVAFGLNIRGMARPEIEKRVTEVLDLVDLEGLGQRDIDQLSGGQQQRVALARSLAIEPRLLLLDEPLGALDRALREKLMIELRDIIKRVGVTAISVTHDQTEAYAIADVIAVMDAGRIVQIAPPETLYRQPNSPFVAHFLGLNNLVPGRWTGAGQLQTPLGLFAVNPPDSATGQTQDKKAAELLIRRDALTRHAIEGGVPINGVIKTVTFRGRYYQITLQMAGYDLVFELDGPRPDTGPFSGFIRPEEVWPLPAETDSGSTSAVPS